MSTDPLAIYLHDHLAGSNFAVHLLESWHSAYREDVLGVFAAELLHEIGLDREELRKIIDRIGAPSHTFKEVVAWGAEKASHFKLHHKANPALGIFEGLEMLALGVLGKLSLWSALAVIAASDARLKGSDYERLALRAKQQHERVETYRLRMAAAAFVR